MHCSLCMPTLVTHKNIIASLPSLCGDGLISTRLNLSTPENSFTKKNQIPSLQPQSIQSKASLLLKQKNLSHGSLQIDKSTIFEIKSNTCPNSFPVTKPLFASDLGLTSKEEGITTFWTKQSEEISKKLWLPTEIDWLDLDSNSSRIFSIGLMPQTSLSMMVDESNRKANSQTGSSPKLQKDTERLENIIEDLEQEIPSLKTLIQNLETRDEVVFSDLLWREKQESATHVMKNSKTLPNTNTDKTVIKNKGQKNSKVEELVEKTKMEEQVEESKIEERVEKLTKIITTQMTTERMINEISKKSSHSNQERCEEICGENCGKNYEDCYDVINEAVNLVCHKNDNDNIMTNFISNEFLDTLEKLIPSSLNDDNTDNINDDFLDSITEEVIAPKKKTSWTRGRKKKKKDCESSDSNIVTRRVRFYPTKNQKLYFNKCFGISRFIYNKGVVFLNDKIAKQHEKLVKNIKNGCLFLTKTKQCCVSLEKGKAFCKEHESEEKRWNGYFVCANTIALRNNAVTNDEDLKEDEKWQSEVPYDTRQLILKDLTGAFESALTNKMKGNIKSFKLGYKTKKDTTQIFHINKKAMKIISYDNSKKNKKQTKDSPVENMSHIEIFKTRKLGPLRVRNKMGRWIKKNIKSIEHNCKIIKYKGGQYYLLLSIDKTSKKVDVPFDVVSLDAGVRTFQTFYSPNGIVGKIGDNFADEKILDTAKRVDHLDSVLAKSKGRKNKRKRRNIRLRQALLRTKIKNSVNDLQWKTATFVCRNFKTAIITPFETQEMVTKEGRKINSTTVRKMLSLSHYSFKKKLAHKAKEYGTEIIIIGEAFTSKTCGNCGEIKKNLGGAKEYMCTKCQTRIDRDINGARNIFLRLIS